MFLSLLVFLSLPLLFLSLLISLIQRNFDSPNGPPTYPIIGCLISFYKNRRRLLHWYTELMTLSPTKSIVISRLGSRRIVVTGNPENVEHILKTNFANYPKGAPFTELLGDFLGLGIFNVDGATWSAQRKLASHEFSTKSLREFVVCTLEEEVQSHLVPELELAARQTKVVDMQDVLRRLAFNAICMVTVGSRLPPGLGAAFDIAARTSAMRGMEPVQMAWKIKRLLNVGQEKNLKEAIKLVHSSISAFIQKKKEEIQKCSDKEKAANKDLLSRLIIAGHSDEMVRDMVISFLMAGRDTTSAALTWLFWLLMGHREVEDEIIREVMSINNGERPLEFEDLKEMKYLKACLCETMRLYPPVVWDSKHAIASDVLPDGTKVRSGDRVTYFPYGMGRMEELWGKDRLEFRPDRWFEADGSGAAKWVSPYKFPVFQAGPRVCLGKEMAFTQMKYVVTTVLRRFELQPVGSDRPAFVPLLTAHMAGGLKVRVQDRTIACGGALGRD